MKKVLAALICVITICLSTNIYAAKLISYRDYDSKTCTKTGEWNLSQQVGFSGKNSIYTTSGRITWFDKSAVIAPARVYIWVTVEEDGCDNAVVTLVTEHYNNKYTISFCEGVSGWREIAIVPGVTSLGITVDLQSGTNGKTYANAIKVEYLDTQYAGLAKIKQYYPDHIILASYSSTGYKNNERIKTDALPLIEKDNAYVSAKSVFKYLGESVSIAEDEAQLTINGITFRGAMGAGKYYVGTEEKNGTFLKTYNNIPVINITAIARAMGKNVFISKRGMALISDNTINMDEKLDKELIVDTLNCLRNE